MTTSDGAVGVATKIVDHGIDVAHYVITILGDGYQQAELPTFATDAQNVVNALAVTPPFPAIWSGVNIYRVDVSSTDSGASDTGNCGELPVAAHTYFDATFCAQGSGALADRILGVNLTTAYSVTSTSVPTTDVILIIVNSTKIGGSTWPGQPSVSVVSKQPQLLNTVIHELGHAAFNLADEYSTATAGLPGGSTFTGPEPKEPNVTAVTDKATIKWKALLTPNVAVPTTRNPDGTCATPDPTNYSSLGDAIGAFEGAAYFNCGLFRPQYTCKMRDIAQPFCHVCSAEITMTMQPYVLPAGPTPTITSFSPVAGDPAGGTIVVIKGSGFTAASHVNITGQVNFGANPCVTYNIDTDTQITAVSPAGIGTVVVWVATQFGSTSSIAGLTFTYSTPSPPPQVSGVSPNTGTIAGGASVVLTGAGFTAAVAVNFGSTPATTFNIDTDTQITAISPAEAAGTVDISVTGPTGTSSASVGDRFTFAAPTPAVTGISPANGPAAGGTPVRIAGTGFTGVTQVMFGTVAAAGITVASDTQITTTSPSGTGTVDVLVIGPTGTSAAVAFDQFTYIAPPVVTAVAPAGGLPTGGAAVALTGTGFSGATAVTFGPTASVFNVVSDTSITATSPAGTGAVDVTVATASGTSTTSPADLFTYSGGPQVTGLTPNSGLQAGGDSIVIAGAGFTGATAVSFGANAANPFNVDNDGQITATSPGGTGTVDVTVTGPAGTSATGAADQFTYNDVPSVTGLSPASGAGAGGDSVVISGSGFTGATAVSFGVNLANPFNVDNGGQITATSPAGGGTVDVTVTTPAGISATGPADVFTYTTAALPGVTKVTPSTGSSAGGDQVTITGVGFTGATGVSFGAAGAFFTVDTDVSIAATSPAGTGMVDVTVTTPQGTTPIGPNDQFTYI